MGAVSILASMMLAASASVSPTASTPAGSMLVLHGEQVVVDAHDAIVTFVNEAADDATRTPPINLRTTSTREPYLFGPWTAREEFGTTDAAEDGALTEWSPHYYIAHDWSDYGGQILSMEPGDQVSVNDEVFTLEAVFDYPQSCFLEEVRGIAGEDARVLQTCIPNSELIRICYGR